MTVVKRWSLFAVALLAGGCSSGSARNGGESGDNTQDLNGRIGCDYSFARPSPSSLKAQGYTFVVRYFSYDDRKTMFRPEAQALLAAGLDIVSNWEAAEEDALDGYSRGVQHAKDADREAAAAGAPPTRPIYFSVDFDASEAQQAAINSYFDGVASVIGRDRAGAYGGYYVVKRLFDAGKIKWGWQTRSWSGGQWDPRLQLRQTANAIAGGSLDADQAMTSDFGQWNMASAPPPPAPPPPAPPPPEPPPPTNSCSVHADGKLWCTDHAGAAMYTAPDPATPVVDHLRTADSWFDCWGSGTLHAGGNTTWYHTIGDDNGAAGWVPGVDLNTTSAFDANPSAQGLARCGGPTATCSVQGDKRLHCDNTAGAPIRATATNGGTIVDHLRTTNSWFECWGKGQLHAGGNTTWYRTVGDDVGARGWVAAVDLSTSSSFDANPSAQGLVACQ